MSGFFWNLYQQRQISDVQAGAAKDRNRAETMQRRADDLEARIDRMALMMKAMWSLLEEKTGMTEAQLAARVHEIDMNHGTVDGKGGPQARSCGKCGRTVSFRHRKCIYCGMDMGDTGSMHGL